MSKARKIIRQLIKEEAQKLEESIRGGQFPVDLSGLSRYEKDLLQHLYDSDNRMGHAKFQGPLEDQEHADILDWCWRKPNQVKRSHKEDVMSICVKLYQALQ
jgi:hypothetical protein